MPHNTLLTLADLRLELTHALDGGTPAAQLDQDKIINEAGRYLFSMHSWVWTQRPPVNLAFTAGDSSINLPDDFGEMIDVRSGTTSVQMTTIGHLAEMLSAGVVSSGTSGGFWGAIIFPNVEPAASAAAPRRWQLHVVPQVGTTQTMTLWYRGRWEPLNQDTDIAAIPVFAQSLLKQLVRAFARGYEHDQLLEMLEKVQQSQFFQNARREDGSVQHSYGRIRHGAISEAGRVHPNFLEAETSAGPS